MSTEMNMLTDEFGRVSVEFKCGHKFGLRLTSHPTPQSVTQEVHDKLAADCLTRICDDCWSKQEYPRFIFSLDTRTVEVEGGRDIYTLLKQRGYHHKGYGSWMRQLPSKKASAAELAWIRKRGYNAVGHVKRCGKRYIVDFRTDAARDAAAAEDASYRQMRKAMRGKI